jgi:predicted ATP-grasp superfamily ATP-dependent carboligase
VLVLVTDGEERAALAACRGFARAGHTVGAAAGQRPALAHWSRACTHKLLAPRALDGERFVVAIAAALRRGSYGAVLPASDAALLALSRFRAELPAEVLIGLPPHDVVLQSLDKAVLGNAAETVGLARLVGDECVDATDARRAAVRLGFPLVVKPQRSLVMDGTRLRREPARFVPGRRELDAALGALGFPVLVQPFHEDASVVSLGGVASPDGVAAVAGTRWRRRWPPLSGAASFCETIVVPTWLVERAHALLDEIGWQGIFELEFLDLGSDRLAPIDLNPRPFGWMALALHAGANLSAVWLERLQGREVTRVVARPGIRYRWEEGDARHFIWQARHRRLRAAARVLRPHRRVVHACFERDDPAPLAAAMLDLSRRAFARSLTRI